MRSGLKILFTHLPLCIGLAECEINLLSGRVTEERVSVPCRVFFSAERRVWAAEESLQCCQLPPQAFLHSAVLPGHRE